MKILITGCCGFIGFHLCKKLILKKNLEIIGIDNLNNYYDKKLKLDRLSILNKSKKFKFHKVDISNKKNFYKFIHKRPFTHIVHLAAQAGVRNSIIDPDTYFKYNLVGFYNILEASRKFKIQHLITASTSSVYGDKKKFPIKETDNSDFPLSFYAATKKSNEVLAYSYSNIYRLPITVLRFFTVFGPYGRPDMALFKFISNAFKNNKVDIYNNGYHTRDFTYIDDVIKCIVKIINKPPKSKIPYEIYNISGNSPKKLSHFIKIIEKNIKFNLIKNYLPLQTGDVKTTNGDNKKLKRKIKTGKFTSIEIGISKFTKWYKEYYKIK